MRTVGMISNKSDGASIWKRKLKTFQTYIEPDEKSRYTYIGKTSSKILLREFISFFILKSLIRF